MNAPEPITNTIKLPAAGGRIEDFRLSVPQDFPLLKRGAFNRIAYSAAHVVADPRAEHEPWLDCRIDWDATIAYRQSLWKLGMGVVIGGRTLTHAARLRLTS